MKPPLLRPDSVSGPDDRALKPVSTADLRRSIALYNAIPTMSGDEWLERACCHATLASLAGRAGSGVSAAEADDEAAKAIGSLRQLTALGYRNANRLQIEAALGPLRGREDFRLMMMDLAMPDEPLAPTR